MALQEGDALPPAKQAAVVLDEVIVLTSSPQQGVCMFSPMPLSTLTTTEELLVTGAPVLTTTPALDVTTIPVICSRSGSVTPDKAAALVLTWSVFMTRT